jgi:hypothetical protein
MTKNKPLRAQPLSKEQLLNEVCEAAERLVHQLQRAEELTRGWSDAEQTNQLTHSALRGCLDRLAATNCWGEANRLPSSELWRRASHWLKVGNLQLHARTKPRGYAGDFEMLEKICTGFLCDHPLGNAFDRFFQSRIAPQAVRNRTQLIADSIVRFVRGRDGGAVHVASVGSGPAIDVRSALDRLSSHERREVRITLMDLDPAALDHARRQIEPLLDQGRIRCVRENLFRIPQKARARKELGDVDFLFCSGLFDYLDDQAAVAMLTTFWGRLAPAGALLAFNFGPQNTSRDYMEWIGNWYLIYRDRYDMLRLAEQSGLDADRMTVAAEDTGANLYWHATK